MENCKIKICGLSHKCDIQAVNIFKPDYIGFVFANSRRQVTPDQALELRNELSPGIIPIGVFVNEATDNILSLIRCGIIDIIQLHGNESEEYMADLRVLTDKPVIKAVTVLKKGDAQRWADSGADYLLLDNKSGGTGRRFDWDLIGEMNRPYFLAGGLNIENIEEAIQRNAPFAVDISSGVETNGFKDAEKINEIIKKVRNR